MEQKWFYTLLSAPDFLITSAFYCYVGKIATNQDIAQPNLINIVNYFSIVEGSHSARKTWNCYVMPTILEVRNCYEKSGKFESV